MGLRTANNREYTAIHKWLSINYGKASKCEICGNKNSKKYDWALKKGEEYKRDRNSFLQLCRSCHVKYDFTSERALKISESQTGNKNNFFGKKFTLEMSEKQRSKKNSFGIKCINIDTKESAEFSSISLACSTLKLQKSNVLRCLKGITKQHKGWKFQKL